MSLGMTLRAGLNIAPADISTTLNAFTGVYLPYSCRVFGAAGKGIPAWTSPTVSALTAAGVVPWVSFKDWSSNATALAAVTSWLDAMPATCPQAFLTYHHEPEGDITPADYRARWATMANTVRSHRNAARIKLVPIHTLYPARHKANDRYSTDWTMWVGVWQQWAPTDAKGAYVGDYMGWDCYLEVTAATYEDPTSFFRIPIGAAYQAGVPLIIPELGAIKIATDPTGIGRANWIASCFAHLYASGAVAVNWWNSTGTNAMDYRLTDPPSLSAWRTALQSGSIR